MSLVGLGALLFGIIEGPAKGWGDASVVGAFVVAVLTLVGFVAWELHTEHPMLPMPYFRNRKFSTGSGVITFGFMVYFFRVVMQVASQWMMFKVSSGLLLYTLISGLIEMLLLGLYFGLCLSGGRTDAN